MDAKFLLWLQGLIAAGDTHPFYLTGKWKALSAEVMRLDKGECQLHKAKGRFKRADLVHHVNHVKKRPDLALDLYYMDEQGNRQRNLISVCRWCHENVCHPERMRRNCKKKFATQERWD